MDAQFLADMEEETATEAAMDTEVVAVAEAGDDDNLESRSNGLHPEEKSA
jgi:hypothetical protein